MHTGPSARVTANDTRMLTGTQNVLMRNEVTQCLRPVFFNPEIQFSMDYNIYKCKNSLLYAQESFHILTQRGRDTKPIKFEYRPGVLTQGWFCPLGNIWCYLETFSVVTVGWRVLLASSGQAPGMWLNILHCTGQRPPYPHPTELAQNVHNAEADKLHSTVTFPAVCL